MAIQIEFYESPKRPGEEEKGVRYHARPVTFHTTQTSTVVNRLHDYCSLSRGDIISALEGLGEVLASELKMGHRVHLKGIGYFQVTLSCSEIKSPKDMRVDNVKFKSIKFRADKILKGDMSELEIRRSRYQAHSAKLSHIEIDSLLTEYFQEHTFITSKKFQAVCQMTRSTAIRHINRLLAENKLKNMNTKSQPFYVPVPGNYRVSVVSDR